MVQSFDNIPHVNAKRYTKHMSFPRGVQARSETRDRHDGLFAIDDIILQAYMHLHLSLQCCYLQYTSARE